jgi:hypothetical protein
MYLSKYYVKIFEKYSLIQNNVLPIYLNMFFPSKIKVIFAK